MSITVVLEFIPKNKSDNSLIETIDKHREVETWANNIYLQYIGARFEIKVLECFTGSSPFGSKDEVDNLYDRTRK